MDTLPKELKKVMQLTQDSLKSFEYIVMVMDERIKVEELYLSGMNKIQAQFNYIKENDPLAFESSALRVDVLQRANHNQYLVEQMKSEQEEMKQLLKKNQEKIKEVETSFRESEKTFKQKVYDLEKQKEKLTQVNKELEEMTLFLHLIESDVAKQNPKWKDKKLIVVNKLKLVQKSKEEFDAIYRHDFKEMETHTAEYNATLKLQYEELVNNSNNLRNSIHDLARKQFVYEVNQIRNIQYDLDNVIKQVDSRPNFSYESEEVSVKLNPHKLLNFQSFFSPFSTDILKKIQEQPVDIDQSISISSSTQLPGLDSNFDCITKEDRTQIQSYFQKGLIDNLNQLSLVKNKKLKDSCHYLMNSVIQSKGDSTDIDVLNLDISIILSEIQSRTSKNRQLHQEKLSQQEEGKKSLSQDQENNSLLKDIVIQQTTSIHQETQNQQTEQKEEIEEGKKQTTDSIPQNLEGDQESTKTEAKEEQDNQINQKEGEIQEAEGQNKISPSQENSEPLQEQTDNPLKEQEGNQSENAEKEQVNQDKKEDVAEIKLEEEKEQEQQIEAAVATEKSESQTKIEQDNKIEENQDKKSVDESKKENDEQTTEEKKSSIDVEKKSQEVESQKKVEKSDSLKESEQKEKVKEEQEIITDVPPVFYDYSDPQNQAIFLIFLECFRQSGKSQITPQQNNQLVIECFRYLDDLSVKKDILQLIKFMPLSFAIYRLTAAEKVFLQEKVKHHFIWTQIDVWEALIFRCVKDELSKLDPSIAEDESMYRNTVYSNLATIGLNMLKFRSTKQSAKNMLGKMAMYYGIPDPQIQDLMNFIENEGQNEKSLSFVKTSNYSTHQAKPNITKGRIITFGQSQQQPANTVTTTTTTNNNSNALHDTKVNPLLQKHSTPTTVQNPLLASTTNNNSTNAGQQRFSSAITPSTQNKPTGQLNQSFGGQANPLLQQQQPLKHQSEFKPSNLFKQEMNSIPSSNSNSAQEANKTGQAVQAAQNQQAVQPAQNTQTAQSQQTAQNPNQPIPQFANQQVPIQVQQQKPNYALPQNKVNSKLFGSNQSYALNNNKNL